MSQIDFFNITVQAATWQRDRQQLCDIRYQVFVDEQQVPPEIEIDDQDPAARHWLACDPEGTPIGTARLESSGKVGRMAVLDNFRGRGVGAALMRRIILDASSQGLVDLYLHAQTHAMPFYKKFGFVASGDEFDEGGIAHMTMRLDLGPYRYRAMANNSVASHLSGTVEIANAVEQLAGESRRKIRIYSQSFNTELLANLKVVESLRQFFTHSSECEIALLVRDIDSDTGPLQPLLALQRQLDTRFGIRQCDERDQTPTSELVILFDDEQLIQSTKIKESEAQLLRSARAEVRQHQQLFEEIWQRSPIPVEVRQLNISG